MNTEEVIQLYNEYVMETYSRKDLVITKARGNLVYGLNDKVYLDFFPGWAVSGLGHCHPRVVKAIARQAGKLIHVSNNYYSELQAKLAQKISKSAFDGKVFFCNSGAEANEGAFKLARVFGEPHRFEIITMENSFHGRTLACLAATGQDKYKKGFEPLPAGFKSVPFNDKNALANAVTDKTAAVMLELIQGEGGIKIADEGYVRFVRELCFKNNILLIFDEVQTGMGRTGKMFCYQNYGVEPDIMTLAKSLGGGVPIGAMIAQKKISSLLKPGMHASTFGGSPLVCAASLAVFEAVEKERLLKNVNRMGEYLSKKLLILQQRYPIIKEIRGKGLMWGVELIMNAPKAYEFCLANGLLINCTQGNTLRIMPALNIRRGEIDKALNILEIGISKC